MGRVTSERLRFGIELRGARPRGMLLSVAVLNSRCGVFGWAWTRADLECDLLIHLPATLLANCLQSSPTTSTV
jgi:hypothetical protein